MTYNMEPVLSPLSCMHMHVHTCVWTHTHQLTEKPQVQRTWNCRKALASDILSIFLLAPVTDLPSAQGIGRAL